MRYHLLMPALIGLLLVAATCAGAARVSLLQESGGRVRLTREWVRMDIYNGYYEVSAQYELCNSGEAAEVKVGFPVAAAQSTEPESSPFKYWLDGKPSSLTHEWRRVGSEKHFQAYWVHTVPFKHEQIRTARITYRAEPAPGDAGTKIADFDFLGGNWGSLVKSTSLVVALHLPGTYVVDPSIPAEKSCAITWKQNRIAFGWSNWDADANLSLTYVSTIPGWLSVDGIPLTSTFAPSRRAVSITNSGRTHVVWMPPAVMHRGEPFIAIRAMEARLNHRAAQGGRGSVSAVSWDPADKEAVLQAGQHQFRFQQGRAIMRTKGKTAIKLPAAPFVSEPPGIAEGVLYVPLKPILNGLGGSYTLDLLQNWLELAIPLFWEQS